MTYYYQHIHPDIDRYAAWTMRDWSYSMSENSVLTSNQCEHINSLKAEQQKWQEMPAVKTILIARDTMIAKVAEMGEE